MGLYHHYTGLDDDGATDIVRGYIRIKQNGCDTCGVCRAVHFSMHSLGVMCHRLLDRLKGRLSCGIDRERSSQVIVQQCRSDAKPMRDGV